MRIALVDAFACLANDLLNAGDHRLEVLALAFDRLVVVSAIAAFNAIDQLSHKAAGLADHALSNRQQPAVALEPSVAEPAHPGCAQRGRSGSDTGGYCECDPEAWLRSRWSARQSASWPG
jgi:hypothetical protein